MLCTEYRIALERSMINAASCFDEGLMNGIAYRHGRRYPIGKVDVLILQDSGVPIRRIPD